MDGTKRMEVGTFATAQRGDNRYALPSYLPEASQGNLGAYGRFTWSLDASPSRMDCHELYQLEVEKKKLQLEMLKQSIRSAEQKLRPCKPSRSSASPDRAGRRLRSRGVRPPDHGAVLNPALMPCRRPRSRNAPSGTRRVIRQTTPVDYGLDWESWSFARALMTSRAVSQGTRCKTLSCANPSPTSSTLILLSACSAAEGPDDGGAVPRSTAASTPRDWDRAST